MSKQGPGIVFAAVKGRGVKSVVRLLTTMLQRGQLAMTSAAIQEGMTLHDLAGMTDCHHIALALLCDLHNARQAGWRIRVGSWNGPTDHSWLESDTIAIDAHGHTDDGRARVMIMERDAYRAAAGVGSFRTYTAFDVASGRYAREEV